MEHPKFTMCKFEGGPLTESTVAMVQLAILKRLLQKYFAYRSLCNSLCNLLGVSVILFAVHFSCLHMIHGFIALMKLFS